MRVLLVMPPNWGVEMPPLGISYVAAAVKHAGHDVTVLDWNLKIWHQLKEKLPLAWSMASFSAWTDRSHYEANLGPNIDPLFAKLLDDVGRLQPDAIGFSVFATSIFPVERVSRLIRVLFPRIKIFYGGPQVRDDYARAVLGTQWVDAAVVGEGEDSANALLRYWESGGDPTIPGVMIKGPDGKIVEGSARGLLKLEALPNPDFSDFRLEEYGSLSLPFSMSRGCVKRCTFCSEAPFWKKYRTRSAESIFNEFKENVEKYGVHNFLSHDSLMNGNFEVLSGLADKIIEADLKVSWQGMCRLDKRMTPELLRKLRNAGCSQISYGLESGSQKMVNLMKKGFRISDALQIIRDTHAAGIRAYLFIIVGFPGETWIDFFKTMLFLFKVRKEISLANVSDAGIMPGSPLADQQEKYGIAVGKWFAGGWRDKYFMNTNYHRLFKLWLMRKYISRLRIAENKLSAPLEPLFEMA